MADDDPVAAAIDELYRRPPEDFMSLRTELAKRAKADGKAGAGKAISNLRKPTVAASVVNRWALEDPGTIATLTSLGDELRRAHHDLDAAGMRELTTRRRSTVAEIVSSALAHSGQDDATTQLRDEVSATFDAAVADPEIADRLGRLTRSESFSGFGLTGAPDLTLVQGGRDTSPKSSTPKKDAMPAATRRRLTRARERAQADLDAADERLAAAEKDESSTSARIKEITTELSELQTELDDAKKTLDQARKAVKTERTKRRDARSALDRAERQLGP